MAWVLVIAMAAGSALLVLKGQPAFLGSAGALVFNLTVAVWALGGRASSLIPTEALPQDFTVQLEWGAGVGLLGALLVVTGCTFVLADQTWEGRTSRPIGWVVPAGLIVAAALIAVREATWLEVRADDFNWELTVDVVPFLGDAMLAMLLVGAGVALVGTLTTRWWLHVVGAVVGLFIMVTALLGRLAEGFVEDIATWLSQEATFLEGRVVAVDATEGALITFAAGGLLLAYCTTRLITRMRGSVDASGSDAPVPLMLGPDDPF